MISSIMFLLTSLCVNFEKNQTVYVQVNVTKETMCFDFMFKAEPSVVMYVMDDFNAEQHMKRGVATFDQSLSAIDPVSEYSRMGNVNLSNYTSDHVNFVFVCFNDKGCNVQYMFNFYPMSYLIFSLLFICCIFFMNLWRKQ